MTLHHKYLMRAIDMHFVGNWYVIPHVHTPTWYNALPYLNRLLKCEP